MRRRGIGIAGLQNAKAHKEQFSKAGNKISQDQVKELQTQLKTFQENLQEFALKYKKEIRKNATFRQHFQYMCSKIGVDPLQSNKGFWAEILGVGDFYYELGVQITEICISMRKKTGGLVEIENLKARLDKRRSNPVSEEDILRSIRNLKPLGTGFEILTLGGKQVLQSLPREMNLDHLSILNLHSLQANGFFSLKDIVSELKWTEDRATENVHFLVREGILWIDQYEGITQYWLPSKVEDI